MAAWVATAIRNKYPDAYIAWAIEPRCTEVIDTQTLVNQLHPIPRDRKSLTGIKAQIHAHLKLRKEGFDYGIDLQGHSKTAVCLRVANPKRRIAARSTDALARRLNPTLQEPSDVHTVEWSHQTLCKFEPFDLPAHPIMPPTAAQNPRKITLSVGAGNVAKRYPLEGWQEVTNLLLKQGYEVIALGGPEEPSLKAGTDLVGKLTLRETLEQVATSVLHLAADTGTGHMAAAYGIPCVSLFGPTNPVKYRPYSTNSQVLNTHATPQEIASAGLELLQPKKARAL
jgi:ADP-heptose:LPS heptosyltransferase